MRQCSHAHISVSRKFAGPKYNKLTEERLLATFSVNAKYKNMSLHLLTKTEQHFTFRVKALVLSTFHQKESHLANFIAILAHDSSVKYQY